MTVLLISGLYSDIIWWLKYALCRLLHANPTGFKVKWLLGQNDRKAFLTVILEWWYVLKVPSLSLDTCPNALTASVSHISAIRVSICKFCVYDFSIRYCKVCLLTSGPSLGVESSAITRIEVRSISGSKPTLCTSLPKPGNNWGMARKYSFMIK